MADIGTDLDDRARSFVAENHRLLDHEGTDLAMGIVMDVGPADADRSDGHPHILRTHRPVQRKIA